MNHDGNEKYGKIILERSGFAVPILISDVFALARAGVIEECPLGGHHYHISIDNDRADTDNAVEFLIDRIFNAQAEIRTDEKAAAPQKVDINGGEKTTAPTEDMSPEEELLRALREAQKLDIHTPEGRAFIEKAQKRAKDRGMSRQGVASISMRVALELAFGL